ncbi:MAG: hypothetical protein J6P57_09555 [Lachnospiraceae bacterium]|nr:hypothetical protein [Lachnospiraceae bacterium]
MKKTHVKKTAYKHVCLVLCGALACGLFMTRASFTDGKEPVENTDTAIAGTFVDAGMNDLEKGTMSKEEYEALVDKEYKESGGMVRFGNYRKRYNVNKTTLFIGTYLIEFSALNETYFRLANITKTQHKQDIEYYKSELYDASKKDSTDDVWVTLTGANLSSLTEGTSLAEGDLDEYWISCVVTEDGAYDPKTGEVKDLTGDDLYDLINLPELLPLKTKYDSIEEKAGRTENETIHNYYTRNILISKDEDAASSDADIFELYTNRGRNEITNRSDIEINALKAFYADYSGEEDEVTAAKASAILDLYAREDARRRVEVYKFLALENAGNEAALLQIKNMIGDRENRNSSFTADSEYIDAIEQSIQNCKESYYLYVSMIPTRGTTVISEYRYLWNNKILDSAYNGTIREDGDNSLQYILAFNNIGAGEIKDAEFETVVLQTILLPEGIKRYENKVLTEVTKDYTTALAEGKSEDVRNDIVMAQYDDAVIQMQELEFLVKSTCDRLEKTDAVSLVQEQIELATLWKTLVFDDPYGPLADYCIDLYIDWLYKLYQEITEGDSGSNIGEGDIPDLDEARARAEDEGDLETLRKLDILEGEYDYNGNSNGDDNDGSGGAVGPGVFKDSIKNMTSGDLLSDLGRRLNDDLGNKNYSIYDAVTRVAADAGFDPNDIIPGGTNGSGGSGNGTGDGDGNGNGTGEDLDGNGLNGGDSALDGANRKKRRDNENYSKNFSDSDGEGEDASKKPWGDISAFEGDLNSKNNANEADFSDSELDNLINELYGASFADLDPDLQAAVVVALNRYGKMHNATNCLEYARKLLTIIMGKKNPLVYAQYEGDHTAEYISLGAVDYSRQYTGYRYVFIDGVDTISKISGTTSYSFADRRVTKSDGETEDLVSDVGYQIDDYIKNGTRFAYINETDAMQYLVESGEYIVDTDWAVLVTAKMEVEVSKIIEKLNAMAEAR